MAAPCPLALAENSPGDTGDICTVAEMVEPETCERVRVALPGAAPAGTRKLICWAETKKRPQSRVTLALSRSRRVTPPSVVGSVVPVADAVVIAGFSMKATAIESGAIAVSSKVAAETTVSRVNVKICAAERYL